MQDLNEYKRELLKLKQHKINTNSHILAVEDYENFSGFAESEIWGNFDDFFQYEDWLKEK